MKTGLAVALLALAWGAARADDAACIGPSSARNYVVYLHGWDSPDPGPTEQANRDVLAKIGNSLKIRFAAPRAPDRCSDDSSRLCWPQGSQADLKRTLDAISQAAAKCFPGVASYGLIGFSNGGYAASRLLQLCVPGHPSWIVTVGSAGWWTQGDPTDLSSCGVLRSVIGSQDQARDADYNYIAQLKTYKAVAELSEYQGGHEFLYDPVLHALGRLYGTGY